MGYKLVCIDMDGTLLNRKRKVTSNTKAVIQKAHENGVEVVITTGRMFSNAAFFSDLIGVKSPVIASNGSFVREKGNDRVIYKCNIEKDIATKIIDICKAHRVRVNFYTPYGTCGNSKLFYFIMKKYIQIQTKEPVSIKFASSYKRIREYVMKNESDIIKCEIVHRDPGKIKLLREALATIKGIEMVWSGNRNIEITKQGTSKGAAVKRLAEHYHIRREEIIAIGDSENDISMIQFAGLGVAMGNSLDRIKQQADDVTSTNDDEGVAKVIEKYILNSSDMNYKEIYS